MNAPSPACPLCGHPAVTSPACPRCRVNVEGYLRGYYRPWACHNRALELAAAGRISAAAREAYAAAVLNPRQYQFRLLLSRLLDAAGETDEAIKQAELADDLSGGAPEVESWLVALFARTYEARSERESTSVAEPELPASQETNSASISPPDARVG